jgi:hypothetical protein
MGGPAMRSFYFSRYLQFWVFAAVLSLFLRANSFYVPHIEGDEQVYLTLASQMGWDLSHYTTMDVPEIARFPYSIYRQPLFHHPPLYPLILKTGAALGWHPVLVGLLFANASMWLLMYYVWRLMFFLRIPPEWGVTAFAGVTFCPLLLASTFMLHHDALVGIYLACGLIAYVEALDQPSIRRALLAGILLCLAFNLRYSALAALPVPLLLQLYQLRRQGPPVRVISRKSKQMPAAPAHPRWLVFGVVSALLFTAGMQHYYRILATYGTLNPSSFVRPDANVAEFSAFLNQVAHMTPRTMALYLVLVFPILLIFVLPWTYKLLWLAWRERSWPAAFALFFLYFLGVQFVFTYHQLRYFAAVTPFLYLTIPFLLLRAEGWFRVLVCGLGVLSLLFMITTGFAKTQMRSPEAVDIVPAPIYYLVPPWTHSP